MKRLSLPKKQFTSWSYSRWRDYEQCPLRASLKHLHKIPEGAINPAGERGAAVAASTEHWLAKATRTMPPELAPMKKDYEALRKTPGLKLELMYGFDRNWAPVPWNDWDRCWLRSKMDVSWLSNRGRTFNAIDNKTGKFKEQDNELYMMQIELYGVTGIIANPTADEARVRLYYSDQNIKFPIRGEHVFTRDEALALIPVWNKRVKAMFADSRFTPRPGDHCRWCPYSRNKSGHCKF